MGTAQIGVCWAHYSFPYERCCGERRCADGATVAGVPGNWIFAGQPCRQVHGGFEGVLGFAHQECLKQIKARSNNGDLETRLFRGDDSVGAALLAPYFARKDRRVHCQNRRRRVAAGSFATRTVSRWSWIQTSTLSVCDVLKHCWSYIKAVTAATGSNSAARRLSAVLKKRNCGVDRVESFVVSFR